MQATQSRQEAGHQQRPSPCAISNEWVRSQAAPLFLGLRAACRMGLEGLVSKRRDRPYQAGRSKHWNKVKNRQHPSMDRVEEFVPI